MSFLKKFYILHLFNDTYSVFFGSDGAVRNPDSTESFPGHSCPHSRVPKTRDRRNMAAPVQSFIFTRLEEVEADGTDICRLCWETFPNVNQKLS